MRAVLDGLKRVAFRIDTVAVEINPHGAREEDPEAAQRALYRFLSHSGRPPSKSPFLIDSDHNLLRTAE